MEVNNTNQPIVCIILVNYNGFSDTVECIESILNCSYKNYRIIVVDNCSSDVPDLEELDYIKKHAVYIQANKNEGFSAGNNIGIESARKMKPDYILLLNNDTIVTENFLDKLITFSEKQDNLGISIGRIHFFYDKNLVWYSGGSYNRTNGVAKHYGWKKKYDDLTPEECQTDITFATGCMMLIPMHVIHKVGLLSEEYFLYAEDTDYCCRVIDQGYRLRYCDDSVIYHKVSSSTGIGSPLSQYYMTRNDLILIRKFTKVKWIAYLHKFYLDCKHIIRGRKKFHIVCKAYCDFFHNRFGRQPL